MWFAQSVRVFLFFGLCSLVGSSRILVIMPMPARSHANLFDPLVEEMAARGHQVTYFTSFPLKTPPPGIIQKPLGNIYNALTELMGSQGNMMSMRHSSHLTKLFMMPILGPFMSDKILEEPAIKELISSNQQFDLILSEAHLDEAVLAGLTHRFKAPFVGLSTFGANPWSDYMVGNPSPPSYIPDTFLELETDMTFWDRMMNTVWYVAMDIVLRWSTLPAHDAVMRKHFGDLPALSDTIKNASLVLVNHHHSLAFPRPYLPNMVEIGGYHIKPPKPLPQDLKKYFDESPHGVILFSMGSHIKSTLLGVEKRQALLNAFSELKENVLWKFEDDSLENVPRNVKISKWLPQSDILAHPNLKLFITHGGLLSTTEAIHWGVPVVGIPLIGDQPINMKRIQGFGVGRILEYDELSKDNILSVVREVLENPKYREKAKQKSAVLRDNPRPPMDTAMFWIEYVIRHKGAQHLRSAVQDLAWYQLYLLDVFAVLAIAAASLILIQLYIIRSLLRRLCGGKATTSRITEKKKRS